MKTSHILEGLTILSKYFNKDGYHCGAEHDIFYVHVTNNPINSIDLQRLVELKWFQPDVYYESDIFTTGDYNKDEGWACYT